MRYAIAIAVLAIACIPAPVVAQTTPAAPPPATTSTSTADVTAEANTAEHSASRETATVSEAMALPPVSGDSLVETAAPSTSAAYAHGPWSIFTSVGTATPVRWRPVKVEGAPHSTVTEFYLIPATLCDQIGSGSSGCLKWIIDKATQFGYGPSAINSEKNLRVADSYYILPVCSDPPRWSHRIPVSISYTQTSVVVQCPH